LFEDSDLLSRYPKIFFPLHEYVAWQNAAPLQRFLINQDLIFLDAMSEAAFQNDLRSRQLRPEYLSMGIRGKIADFAPIGAIMLLIALRPAKTLIANSGWE
jgi:hypothetical protein